MDAVLQGSYFPIRLHEGADRQKSGSRGQSANKTTKDRALGARNWLNDNNSPLLMASGFWL
ncbi:hypothetical protein ACFW0H_26480 [Pseudomonas sp. CR3202]|uniref:hypothetical protein n=1 Tax=Pseudomonas sp. CR3202 TaxID=3351532 RepID=UPI003BEF6A16